MERFTRFKKTLVAVMINEMMGVSKITHRNEYFEGTIKNPPMAMAVRMKLKPM